MRTIEEIKANCEVIEDDFGREHWIWHGAYDERKKVEDGRIYRTPVVRAPDYTRSPDGKKTTVQFGARAVWHISRKKPIPAGRRAYRVCEHEGCMHEDCVKVMTPVAWGKMVRTQKRYQNLPGWSAKAVKVWDKIGRRVPDEIVIKAITSTVPATKLAPELGINASTICRYRRGEFRKQALQKQMGPFAGLVR